MCFLRWPPWAHSTASKRFGDAENIGKCPRVDVCFCLISEANTDDFSYDYIFSALRGTDKRLAYSKLKCS